MANTTTEPSVKKYYDYAQQQVDEQAIADKFNAATIAQFNAQREQNRQNENAFYNQMYNTQKTAMDTIRQSNAAAVASGASRGVQAAQELSSLLGLQQESVASATELAQANRQTAQEETAAVLENVLNAYQQSVQQRQQLVQQGIESASVDVQSEANKVAAQEAEAAMKQADAAMITAESNKTQAEASKLQAEAQMGTLEQTKRDALQSALQTSTEAYLTELQNQGYDYASEATTEGYQSLNAALNSIPQVTAEDINSLWSRSFGHESTAAIAKTNDLENTLKTLSTTYGLNYNKYKSTIDDMREGVSSTKWFGGTKDDLASAWINDYNYLIAQIKKDYSDKIVSKTKK